MEYNSLEKKVNRNLKDERRLLLEMIRKGMQYINEIEQGTASSVIKEWAKSRKEDLEKIKFQCEVEKYKLYFNGKVGVGKSTLISSLLNLIDENDIEEKGNKKSGLLLKTGSGSTTVCETVIVPNVNKTEIIVEGITEEQLEKKVREFYGYIIEENSDLLSKEEIRVLANMSNIPSEYKKKNKDIYDYLEQTLNIDLFNEEEKVISYLMEEIKYNQRKKTNLSNEEDDNVKLWLKKTFEKINDGKIKNVPFPKRVILNINVRDIDMGIPDFIEKVIDTRGLKGSARKDVEEKICKEDSISLFCDEINAIGTDRGIIENIKHVLVKENKFDKYRVALVGLEKDGELSEINDADGDRGNGIVIKQDEAMKHLTDEKICFLQENIFFVDSIDWLRSSTLKEIELVKEKREDMSKEFFEKVECMLVKMYEQYQATLCEYLRELRFFRHGNIEKIKDTTLTKIEKIECEIKDIKEKLIDGASIEYILKRFEKSVTSSHASALRGAINHNGIGNKISLLLFFRNACLEELDKICKPEKDRLLGMVQAGFDSNSEFENHCSIFFNDQIDSIYSKKRSQYMDLSYEVAKKELHEDIELWRKLIPLWGSRSGNYRENVKKTLVVEIVKKQSIEKLEHDKFCLNIFETIREKFQV